MGSEDTSSIKGTLTQCSAILNLYCGYFLGAFGPSARSHLILKKCEASRNEVGLFMSQLDGYAENFDTWLNVRDFELETQKEGEKNHKFLINKKEFRY